MIYKHTAILYPGVWHRSPPAPPRGPQGRHCYLNICCYLRCVCGAWCFFGPGVCWARCCFGPGIAWPRCLLGPFFLFGPGVFLGPGVCWAPGVFLALCVVGGRCFWVWCFVGSLPKGHHANLLRVLEPCGFSQLIENLDDETCIIKKWIRPTTIFSLVHRRNAAAFKLHFGCDPDNVQQFWEQLFSSREGRQLQQNNRFLIGRSPADLRYSVPGVLHEDAGPFTKAKSTNILSWGSLLATGRELRCRFLAFSYIKRKGQAASVVAEAAWDAFNSDLESLAVGVCPRTGEKLTVDEASGRAW